MTNPYTNLSETQYWRTAVANKSAFQISGLWAPKFQIKKRSRIVTAGSCFAQHIGRALKTRGYKWIDAEPAPDHMTDQAKLDYHYGTFSFRTGNIYTPNMLHQWLNWAEGNETPPAELWEKDGRFYDPFRPAVEVDGFATPEAAYRSRDVTISAVRRAVEEANVFVFTLGLTEAWKNRETNVEYAICPGTIAGTFDPEQHVFQNHSFSSTRNALKSAIKSLLRMNSKINILLTVSPVPLTATASGKHVLTATSQSKATLLAAATDIADSSRRIDYFPSFEIINHPAFNGMFFAPNKRSVDPRGVDFVMENFFRDQTNTFARSVKVVGPYGVETEKLAPADEHDDTPGHAIADPLSPEDIRCEEEILDAFS